MAKTKLFRFLVRVQGQSDFPIDMLRYDALHPQTEPGAHAIARSLQEAYQPEPLVIPLTGIHEAGWEPNRERWRSRGWNVTHVEQREEIR